MVANLSRLAIVKSGGQTLHEFSLYTNQPATVREMKGGIQVSLLADGRLWGSIPLEDGLFLVVERNIRGEFVALVKDSRAAMDALNKSSNKAENLFSQVSFVLLALLLLLSLMFFWNGLAFSTWITEKMAALLNSTSKISKGDLKWRIPGLGKNEFGFLGKNLNQLVDNLTDKNKRLRAAQMNTQRQNQFIEAMLNGVSSGIVCLNEQGKIHLMNNSAADLLSLDKKKSLGEPILSLVPEMESFEGLQSFHMELIRKHKRIFLVVNMGKKGEIALLPGGRVMTMEDITLQIENQKQKIWAHIARSLAHEIKNPLTPIQLSAERLMNKYSPKSEEGKQDFFTSINSIIKQVEAIQGMVDSFSSFARMPRMRMEDVNLEDLIAKAVSLNRSQYPDVKCEVRVEKGFIARCDSNAMNRVLVNLLKNASQALEGEGIIMVSADLTHDGRVCLLVQDNGSGFPPHLMDKLINPYVTARKGGSGLGLAIVNRIAEAHGGLLVLENLKGGDGKVTGALAKLIWKAL